MSSDIIYVQTEIINTFRYKLLRKYNNKCSLTGDTISDKTSGIVCLYDLVDLIKLCEDNLTLVYWFIEKYWEDILKPVSTKIDCGWKYIPIPDDINNKIQIVKDNLSTGLGQKTNYVDTYDPSLLVPVKRSIARDNIGYEHIPFVGLDIWNAWEVSYLDRHGKPQCEVLRIGYDSDSESIIESKSFKLYLNSFNNTKVDGDLYKTIMKDVAYAAKANTVYVVPLKFEERNNNTLFKSIDSLVADEYYYEYNPDILTIKPTTSKEPIYLTSNLLKSNCRHSGLPDWGALYLSYMPSNATIDEETLLQYIISYRNHQEFHEECCERIFHDLYYLLNPVWIKVELKYTRRGGLDINPIRVCSKRNEYNYTFIKEFSNYTVDFRQ